MDSTYMTPELMAYYESRLEMTTSPGWRDLMADVEQMLAATNTLSGVTADNFRFKQGEVSIMRWLLALADMSDKSYEQLKEDDANT